MVEIRKAKIRDVKKIHSLLLPFASEGRLLPRSLSELYTRMRDFFVADDGGAIVGCAALKIIWDDLSEIASLAVRIEYQRQGIGRKLVEACLDEASSLGLPKTFVLTYETAFFERLGFRIVDKSIFPQKIWVDCLKCPKFPDCDEVAMVKNIS
ncbi:MAG: N-acetyltransferase [Syntrophobacterales bacterium]|nr:N-acetyltransferase [Syntrophobacterales bacterium]